MKYYRLALKLGGEPIIPGMDGSYVKNKKLFFDTGEMGPNKFYDHNWEFDYLVPKAFGDPEPEAETIADYHMWHGENTPWGGTTSVVSQKFKEVLCQFNLSAGKFYKARVLYKGEYYPYFVWQVLQDEYIPYIDFEHSEFNNLTYSRSLEQVKLEIKKFSTLKEVDDYSEKNWGFNWNYERLVLKPEFRKLDFCMVQNLYFIASERLKEAVEKAGIFGVVFYELPISIEFSDEI
jgi:hypothetical protein